MHEALTQFSKRLSEGKVDLYNCAKNTAEHVPRHMYTSDMSLGKETWDKNVLFFHISKM